MACPTKMRHNADYLSTTSSVPLSTILCHCETQADEAICSYTADHHSESESNIKHALLSLVLLCGSPTDLRGCFDADADGLIWLLLLLLLPICCAASAAATSAAAASQDAAPLATLGQISKGASEHHPRFASRSSQYPRQFET